MRKSLYDYCAEHDRTELLDQWDDAANLPLTPQTVSYGSKQKAAWHCEKGHKWHAQVSSRTCNHAGCPVCAGLAIIPGENDLATLFPAVVTQWHPTLNGAFTPEDVTCGSAKKVWWLCNVCGYEWKAVIYSRAGAQRCGCPMCAGKVRMNNRARYQYIAMEAPRPVFNHRTSSGRAPLVQCSPPGMNKTGTDPP